MPASCPLCTPVFYLSLGCADWDGTTQSKLLSATRHVAAAQNSHATVNPIWRRGGGGGGGVGEGVRACKHVGAWQHKHLDRFPRHTAVCTSRCCCCCWLCDDSGPGWRGGEAEGWRGGEAEGQRGGEAEGWSGGVAEERKSQRAFKAPGGIKAINNLLQRLGKANGSCVAAFTVRRAKSDTCSLGFFSPIYFIFRTGLVVV